MSSGKGSGSHSPKQPGSVLGLEDRVRPRKQRSRDGLGFSIAADAMHGAPHDVDVAQSERVLLAVFGEGMWYVLR